MSSQPVAVARSRPAPLAAPSVVAPLPVPDSTLNRLTDVFKMLADKSRLQIVLALSRDGELHVSALCELLHQSQPAVSHHLTLMRMVGLVDYNRVGKHNFYRLAAGHIRTLLEQFFSEIGDDHRQLHFSDFALTFKPR